MSQRASPSSGSSDGGDLWPSLQPTPEWSPETTVDPSTTFPSMKLPPQNFQIEDQKTLEGYLQSSPALFEAYVSEFHESQHFELLKRWVNFDGSFLEAVVDEIRRELWDHLGNMRYLGIADTVGVMFLSKVFDGWLTLNQVSSQSTGEVREEAELFFKAVMALHQRTEPPSRAPVATGLDEAFGATYMDPHRMLNYYGHELQKMSMEWFQGKERYMAPYTSIVTSSMMGKSRLIKEMASFIPTVYLCLRESKERSQQVDGDQFVDGYPDRSSDDVIKYLFRETRDGGEKELERHYICFFLGVLEALAFWVQSLENWPSPSPHEINERLWHMLAEPSKLSRDHYSALRFWKTAIKNAQNHYSTSQASGLKLLLQERWTGLKLVLLNLNLLGEQPEFPLLLFVFDEARALVKIGLGGNPIQNDEEMSRFRILRRAIRQVGMLEPPIRIFTVFTDTTSKISNFQPSIAPHSANKALRAQRGNDLFPPIVILPTFDYHANYRLRVTDDPIEVARPQRLFCFGRSAWYSILDSGTPCNKLVALAEAKLTRRDADSLRKLFQTDPLDEESRLVMLALMGTRLALQTGSFTALLPELVSSHLMVLMRVSDDHEQLEAFYPSEPILANASSNITSTHGWTRPCQAMVSLFRHGMVEKGFRGEYVTKTLCCLAFEDACRQLKEKEQMQEDDSETLWYSRPVPAFSFLNCLLRNPSNTSTGNDDHGKSDDSGGSTMSVSSTSKGVVSQPQGVTGKRRLSDIPEEDEEGINQAAAQSQSPDPQKRKRPQEPQSSPGNAKKRKKTGNKPKPRRVRGNRFKPTDYDDPDVVPIDDFFDDWVSDEEDLPNVRDEDTVPAEEKTGLSEYFLSTVSSWYDTRYQTKKATQKGKDGESRYDRCLKDIEVLQKGAVFLTHWVSIKTKLRPSTLFKAWNRGAGIMTRANTPGIDFVIPIMLGDQNGDKSAYGPLFGKWTIEQEKAASRAISYILLDAKNDASLSLNDITLQAVKCAPSSTNFKLHRPLNPFISIIASYATSDDTEPVKLLRDATIDTDPNHFSVGAQGLSGAAFKCLQGRPNLTKILTATLQMDRNPLRGSAQLFQGVRNTTRDYYHLATHPGREFNFYESL